MEICPGQPMLYGGCGIAIEAPMTQLSVETNAFELSDAACWRMEEFSSWRDRIQLVVERTLEALSANSDLRCDGLATNNPSRTLRIERPPVAHAGLGSGTQLACCVATLVAATCYRFHGEDKTIEANALWSEVMPPEGRALLNRLAASTGRGARSYIGLACHLFGGFIVDSGVPEVSQFERKVERFSVPETWRIVLARPISSSTVSGTLETDYFQRCEVPNPNRQSMLDIIADELRPAIQAQDLPRFGEAIYRYGRMGGELFRSVQGGVYRDAEVTELVETIRRLGVKGTGQTSWGPTVYAFVENQNEAVELENRLHLRLPAKNHTMITQPTNRPATVSIQTQ